MLLEIFLGLLCAVLVIYLSSKWHPRKQLKLWSNSLIIAALVYIAFVCYNAAWSELPQELMGVAGYGLLAILGYRYSPIFLAIGWALHVFWDIILHSPTSIIAPQWYPGLCLGFDIAIAGYLIYLIVTKGLDLKQKAPPAID